MSLERALPLLCLAIPTAPAAAFALLALCFLAHTPPSERTTSYLVASSLTVSLVAALAIAGIWAMGENEVLLVEAGRWFGTAHYGFQIVYQIDGLSAAVLPVVAAITLIVAHFAVPYMHREAGFTRFFLQLTLFAAGMYVVVLAGSADLLVVGWECIGLASALLVTFFHERIAPPRAATRVFTTYRLCDVGLLVGTMLMHGLAGSAAFAHAFGAHPWPGSAAALATGPATALALAFTLAACGKSAQFPLGSWLPRAMEGPTPSSAVFYGGPAVHSGIYLLLRTAPLFQAAPFAAAMLVVIGSLTALHATIVCRVQSDRKGVLAYATMTQLGLMVVECGLGWWSLARWHMLTHICLRTYQLLRAPSALRDAHIVRATNQGQPLAAPELALRVVPTAALRWAYHLGLERTHLDSMVERWVVDPILHLGRRADHLERRCFSRLAARPPAPATARYEVEP